VDVTHLSADRGRTIRRDATHRARHVHGAPGRSLLPMPERPVRASAPLDLGSRGKHGALAAVWWLPPAPPTGLVWLQHGFSRHPKHLASLASSIASATGALVLTPAVSSNFLRRRGAWINGEAMHRNVADLFASDRVELQRSLRRAASSAGLTDVVLPARYVLGGHSAGGNLALGSAGWIAAGDDERALGDLAGVVMLDGVDRAGMMAKALARLDGERRKPVWTIAAPDSSCNAKGKGTRALRGSRPDGFVGVLLEGGTHVDAEGDDSGTAAERVCGRPLAENVAAVKVLAADWVTNLLGGTPGDGLLAATAPGDRSRVGDATAVTL